MRQVPPRAHPASTPNRRVVQVVISATVSAPNVIGNTRSTSVEREPVMSKTTCSKNVRSGWFVYTC